MTRRRWIADEVEGDRAALTGSNAVHLARVLRAQTGQEFDISTGTSVRRGVVASVNEERVEFELREELTTPAGARLTLVLAIFKFDRFEWALEKCTELGVTQVVPVVARRTDTHLAQAAGKRVERWQRIVREAAQQSRRVAPPEIAQPTKLREALVRSEGVKVVLSEVEDGTMLRDTVPPLGSEVTLAVGPEGGWTEEELQLFAANGWRSASLGQTILRAETAAIAAVAVLASLR